MKTHYLLLLPALILTAQPPKPDAAQILDRYIEATGGRARYEKLRTLTVVANVELQDKDIQGRVEMYQAAGGASYVLTEMSTAGKIEQGTAEGIAWERSARSGARIKHGDEAASALRDADLRARLEWRRIFPKVSLAGTEMVDLSQCYKVVMTPAQGRPETRYYDMNTGLLLKSARVVSTQVGEIPAETRFYDYRDVGGILTPFRLEQHFAQMVQVTTIEKLSYDQEIPPGKFALPAEIKALISNK